MCTLRAPLFGTFLQGRKDVVNQCLEFGLFVVCLGHSGLDNMMVMVVVVVCVWGRGGYGEKGGGDAGTHALAATESLGSCNC